MTFYKILFHTFWQNFKAILTLRHKIKALSETTPSKMHQHRLNLLKYKFVHISINFYWLVMKIYKVLENHSKIWMTFRKIRFCLDNPIFFRFHIFMKFWNFAGGFSSFLGRLCKNPSDMIKYKALSFIKWFNKELIFAFSR